MAKVDRLRKKYPHLKFEVDLVGDLNELDKTETKKYLPFMVKCADSQFKLYIEEVIEKWAADLGELVEEFDEYCQANKVDNKDINSYKTIDSFVNAIEEARKRKSQNEIKLTESRKIYEDDKVLIVKPLTARTSRMYGSDTKWCTASKEHTDAETKMRFNSYTKHGVLIYVIFKDGLPDKNYNRVAILKPCNSENVEYWLAHDVQTNTGGVMKFMNYLGVSKMQYIIDELERNVANSKDRPKEVPEKTKG